MKGENGDAIKCLQHNASTRGRRAGSGGWTPREGDAQDCSPGSDRTTSAPLAPAPGAAESPDPEAGRTADNWSAAQVAASHGHRSSGPAPGAGLTGADWATGVTGAPRSGEGAARGPRSPSLGEGPPGVPLGSRAPAPAPRELTASAAQPPRGGGRRPGRPRPRSAPSLPRSPAPLPCSPAGAGVEAPRRLAGGCSLRASSGPDEGSPRPRPPAPGPQPPVTKAGPRPDTG